MRHLNTFLLFTLALILCACASSAGAAVSRGQRVHNHRTLRRCENQSRHRNHRRYCAVTGKVDLARIHHKQTTVSPEGNAGSTAAIASVLASPCENTQLTPTESNLALVRQATLCLVNQERATHGELPLQPNSRLEQSAEDHSQDMISEDYFSHYTPSGEGPAERVQATGYIPTNAGWKIGENIAWGTSYLATPESIVQAWIASPEHLENILESNYRDTGIGVYPAAPAAFSEGQPGAIYTQDFGVIEG